MDQAYLRSLQFFVIETDELPIKGRLVHHLQISDTVPPTKDTTIRFLKEALNALGMVASLCENTEKRPAILATASNGDSRVCTCGDLLGVAGLILYGKDCPDSLFANAIGYDLVFREYLPCVYAAITHQDSFKLKVEWR